MGKKNKKALKKMNDVFLETSPKSASQADVDNCELDSSRTEELTCSSRKAKKKRKKIDMQAHEGENEGCELPSDEISQLILDDDDGALVETIPNEAPPRKKKKKDKLELTESKNLKKKGKKSSREMGSKDPHDVEEVDENTESEERESKSKESSDIHVRKKKNKKKKHLHKDASVPEDNINKINLVATSAQDKQLMLEDGEDEEEFASPTRLIGTAYTKRKQKRGSERIIEIDPKLLEELQEFVPNVESRNPMDIVKMINYDLPRYRDFKKRGIPLIQGRFTMKENEKIRKNVEDFMALTGIDSVTKLFFPQRFQEEQRHIRRLKKMHRFFERIADGIARSCHDVYICGRRLFDDRNHMGPFSKEEINTLCKLQKLYGNDWTKISELTGRSPASLEKRFTQFCSFVNEGAWTEKEVQRLMQAVREHLVSQLQPGEGNSSDRVPREKFFKRLPWQNISAKVKTRTWAKCREKWMSILAVKMSSGAVLKEEKSYEMKVKLIKAMYDMQVDDAAFVNWDDLTEVIGDVPPAYVQRKWHKLKVCYVPNWQSKCFADVIDFLYENVLPRFEKKLKDCSETEENQQESFLLSDIFQDIKDDYDDDCNMQNTERSN